MNNEFELVCGRGISNRLFNKSEIAQFIQEKFDYGFINVKELDNTYYVITVDWGLYVGDNAVIYADDVAIGWGKINKKTFIL